MRFRSTRQITFDVIGQGAPAWHLHATVDIVASSHLEHFAQQRHSDVTHLLSVMKAARKEIAQCFQDKSLDGLNVTKGARGIVGLHRLFREIHNVQKRLEAPEPETDS